MQLTPAEQAARDAAAERDAGLSRVQRKRAGVVHTPPELARFVARAADVLLRRELGLARGLADEQLLAFDPACGPGAFLAAALAVTEGRGAMRGVDRDAQAIGMARAALKGSGCTLDARDTLNDVRPEHVARLAPALCVLGNPPWVASAQAAPAPHLAALLEDFRREAGGERVKERKLGVLADAYVRFLRWGCEVTRRARAGGVLAFVTNASYLDGPVHRALRAALRRWFCAIHVVDLGGSALLARRGPRDENVFGVRPSVAILLAARRADHDERELAPVRYARVHGTLAHKLALLADANLDDLPWRTLLPSAEHHRFVPTAEPSRQYARAVSLAEAMPFQREGVQTNRDAVVVDTDRERLVARMHAFARGQRSADLVQANTPLSHYDPKRARRAVQEALEQDPDGTRGVLVRRIQYRPFDARWFVPLPPLCHRPRPALIAAFDREPFALVSVRKDRGDVPWAHATASVFTIDNCLLSTRSSCRARAFPALDPDGQENLAPAVAERWSERLGRRVSARDFAHYALALLCNPEYRARNDQALRIDYPRITEPSSAEEFELWRQRGAELAELLSAPLVGGGSVSTELIAIDRASGEVRLDDAIVRSVSPAALALRIGHHVPLIDRMRDGAVHRLSFAELGDLCARLEALYALSRSEIPEGK